MTARDAVNAAIDADEAAQYAAGAASRDAEVNDLTDQLAKAKARIAELEAASQPPPAPAPAPSGTRYGFNIMQSYGSTAKTYFDRAGETADAMNARLVRDYGPFKAGKTFPNRIVADAVSQTAWGKFPSVVDLTLCIAWTYGQVATGSQDAALTSLMRSVPAGKYVRLCWNEIDYKVASGSADQKSYAADMAHLKALRDRLGLASTVGIFHCFGEWNIEQGYDYSWVDAGNCDGIIWDFYENKAGTDDGGSKKLGLIAAKNKALGVTRWGVGEHGDRRPGSGSGAWGSDAARAKSYAARLTTAASLGAEVMCVFNVVGSSGDHRILDADTATKAAVAGFTR